MEVYLVHETLNDERLAMCIGAYFSSVLVASCSCYGCELADQCFLSHSSLKCSMYVISMVADDGYDYKQSLTSGAVHVGMAQTAVRKLQLEVVFVIFSAI